jgi:hypothetical protein
VRIDFAKVPGEMEEERSRTRDKPQRERKDEKSERVAKTY